MEKVETILEYYQATNRQVPFELLSAKDEGTQHFNILKRRKSLVHLPYQRQDYFKICVTTGNAILLTDKGEINIDKPAIFFSNPTRKFGWKIITTDQEGYVCLFNEKTFYSLDNITQRFLSTIFNKNGSYLLKRHDPSGNNFH